MCGDHVLIFSDKTIAWQGNKDARLAWKRWAKRAIAKSVDQIRGAERWIAQYPDRIFIDRKCTQKLPIALPPPESRKVHIPARRRLHALAVSTAFAAHKKVSGKVIPLT